MRALALLLALLVGGCAEAHPAPVAEYAVRLDLADGVCSGTIVGRNLILTASHCLKDNRITHIDGKPAYALKAIHDGKDHVLVRVSLRFNRWATVGGAPLVGDRVKWEGNPAAQPNVYREGYVSRSWTDEVWVQADVFGGDSGAGVYCPDGRVCGIVSAGKIWTRGPFSFSVMVVYPLAFSAKDWKEIA